MCSVQSSWDFRLVKLGVKYCDFAWELNSQQITSLPAIQLSTVVKDKKKSISDCTNINRHIKIMFLSDKGPICSKC